MIIIWGSRWWVGVYSLIGTVVAASGPVSTAAVPFSNLVVSIVVACTCFYFCISTSGCSLPNDTLGCVAASRTKGRRCLISSLRRWVVVLLGRRRMIMNVNKLISWWVGLGWVMWSTASEWDFGVESVYVVTYKVPIHILFYVFQRPPQSTKIVTTKTKCYCDVCGMG